MANRPMGRRVLMLTEEERKLVSAWRSYKRNGEGDVRVIRVMEFLVDEEYKRLHPRYNPKQGAGV